MQRTEKKITPKQKKQVNAKPKRGLENLTEHRKCHNENRQREDKYRISSPRASGGGSCSGSPFAFGGLGGILRFPGLVHVVKQLELALDRAEEEELGQPLEAGGSWISSVAKGERVPGEPTIQITTTWMKPPNLYQRSAKHHGHYKRAPSRGMRTEYAKISSELIYYAMRMDPW